MRVHNRLTVVLFGALLFGCVTCAHASLQNALPNGIQSSTDAKSIIQSKGSKVIDILGLFGMFACVAGAVYGGIKIGTGDPEKGKSTIISSLIGATIILSVYSLIGIVVN